LPDSRGAGAGRLPPLLGRPEGQNEIAVDLALNGRPEGQNEIVIDLALNGLPSGRTKWPLTLRP